MKSKKSIITLIVLLFVCFASLFCADRIQKDNGNVEIITDVIEVEDGNLAYKLYKPKDVSASNKAPAVLMLHGYQNDHETCAAYAIELSRRGYVVLAIDEFGHGKTDIGLRNRGYVDHKVTVNFGNDSKEDGTYVEVNSSVGRYKLMMNFSNLSFFNDYYSKGSDGSEISDSSCGGIAAYAYLASLDYVDNKNMAVSGHSMGTWSSWTVAAAYSGTEIEPRATVLQCGELFRNSVYDNNIHFNNVLLLQAKYDEFSYFRDYQNIVSDDLLDTDLRKEFMLLNGSNVTPEWNKTFGNFNDGTARRMELLITNHRLTTHNTKGLATALEWFDKASNHVSNIAYDDQVANTKELLNLIAMFAAIFAMLPLMEILLGTKFFANVGLALPSKDGIKKGSKWFTSALITILLAGASYPFMSQLGHGLLPLPENIFRMTIGNGFLSYLGLLLIISVIMFVVSRCSKKNKQSLYELGLSCPEKENKLDISLIIKSLLLALCMVGMMYIIVFISDLLFRLDLRYIWPMFATFNGIRIVQFFMYIWLYVLYYIFAYSKIMASLRTESSYQKGFGGFIKSYLKSVFVMCGGVILIVLIEYIPFFANIGPGVDLLFGSTFGGPFMSLLILFLPQLMVYALIGTYTYRRTGNIYTGAFVCAMLACWLVTGGSSFF